MTEFSASEESLDLGPLPDAGLTNITAGRSILSNRSQPTTDLTFLLLSQLLALKRGTGAAETVQRFLIVFAIFGTCAVILNTLVIIAIVRFRRRTIYKMAFYILVMNFAIIDLLRGFCLILRSMRIIAPVSSDRSTRLFLMKIDQLALMALRFTFLATIFNVVSITVNEYLYIQYPLRYYKSVTPARTVKYLLIVWLGCIVFIVTSTFVRDVSPPLIRNNTAGNLSISRSENPIHLQQLFNVTILAFCFLATITVIVCYIHFSVVVRRIQRQEAGHEESICRRKFSEVSIKSNDFSDPRSLKIRILRRYKATVTIGLVIFLYVGFIVTYGTVQVLHMTRLKVQTRTLLQDTSVIFRYSLQLSFGLHAVFQPLCYFRMREFRKIFQRSLHCVSCRRGHDYGPKRKLYSFTSAATLNQNTIGELSLATPISTYFAHGTKLASSPCIRGQSSILGRAPNKARRRHASLSVTFSSGLVPVTYDHSAETLLHQNYNNERKLSIEDGTNLSKLGAA